MLKITKRCLMVMVLVSLLLSCEKLPEVQDEVEMGPGVKMEVMELSGPIPSQWGDLISVSSVAHHPKWVQLWFQDKDGTVYMIPYNVTLNTFHKEYRYIKRG